MEKDTKNIVKLWLDGLNEMNQLFATSHSSSSFLTFVNNIEDNFQYSLKSSPKTITSGLVEMQKLFLKSAK